MMARHYVGVGALIFGLMTGVAYGQAAYGQGSGGGQAPQWSSPQGQSLYLLLTPQMQKELEIVPEQLEQVTHDTVTGILDEVATHEEGPLLGACARAEAFLGTWRPSLPFGRPLAA